MEHISLYRIKTSPNWQCQYTDRTGKIIQVSTRCKLKPDALKWLADRKAEEIKELDTSSRLSGFISDFMRHAEAHHKPASVWLFKSALSRLKDHCGDIPITSITPEHIDTWKSALSKSDNSRGRVFSVQSVNILFRSAKSAFNTARRWKRITVSPFADCQTLPTGNVAPAFLSVDDLRKASNFARGINRDIIIFAGQTGIRLGELLNLKWSDVSGEHIIVRNTEDHGTKDEETRAVPLTADAVGVLRRRKKEKSGEYVFHREGRRLIGSSVSHAVKRAMRDAGLDERLHMHSLRHTCASLLIQNGAHINAVKEILGHSSIAVTQIYTHNDPESLRREMAKMPSLKTKHRQSL